jgi:hypothetical protein
VLDLDSGPSRPVESAAADQLLDVFVVAVLILEGSNIWILEY